MSSSFAAETRRRRTFAIISHPDAGKTTLTEKLLLFSGAIQIAGSVKARKASRHATSDWMEIEKQRGISVASSVMQMEYRDCVINLLDTPGHQDFSEDTYRVLTAVDAALMVIDAANGVEPQTRRLLQVCRARNTPILTFVNKMDREVQEPLALMDEIERELGMAVVPFTWPVGMGKLFGGVLDLRKQQMRVFSPDGYASLDFQNAQGTVIRKNPGWDFQKLEVEKIDRTSSGSKPAISAWACSRSSSQRAAGTKSSSTRNPSRSHDLSCAPDSTATPPGARRGSGRSGRPGGGRPVGRHQLWLAVHAAACRARDIARKRGWHQTHAVG